MGKGKIAAQCRYVSHWFCINLSILRLCRWWFSILDVKTIAELLKWLEMGKGKVAWQCRCVSSCFCTPFSILRQCGWCFPIHNVNPLLNYWTHWLEIQREPIWLKKWILSYEFCSTSLYFPINSWKNGTCLIGKDIWPKQYKQSHDYVICSHDKHAIIIFAMSYLVWSYSLQ